MSTVIAQTVVFEIKLYLKNKKFWCGAILINAYAWAAFFLAGQVISGVAQMFIPVLLFLCAEAVTKDQREDFTEIISTLPYNTVLLLSGRALAVLLWFMLLGIELLLTMLVAANLSLPVYISWSACLTFMVKYFVACINVLGITFIVFSITKNAVRLYAILFVWWLLGVFLMGNTGVLFPQGVALANFTFIHGFGGNPSEISGLYPYGEVIAAIGVFQITWSTILFIVAVIIESAKRGSRKTILATGVSLVLSCIVIMVVTVHGAGQYLGIENSNYKDVWLNSGDEMIETANHSEQSMIVPVGYDLYITLDSKLHKMAVKAQVTLKNTGEASVSAIEFTLRDYLRVQRVVNMANGETLAWQQQGSSVTINPSPGSFTAAESLTVEISYSGTVWEWAKDFYGQPTGFVNFVDSPFTFLRGGYAWYPVLGRQPLYAATNYYLPWTDQPKQLVRSLLVAHSPVPFKMTVDSDSDEMLISNIELINRYSVGSIQRHEFNSDAGRDVFLLAGPYEHRKIVVAGTDKLVDVYHFPAHDHNLHNMAYKVNQIEYYSSLIPRGNGAAIGKSNSYSIYEAPRFLTYDILMNSCNLGVIDAIYMPEAIFLTKALKSPWWSQPAGKILSEARSLNIWWPNCFSKAKGDIADGLALYMYTLYVENKHGKKFYDNAREYWKAYNDKSPDNDAMLGQRGRVVQEVFLLMDTIRQSNLGDEGVKQFLRIVNTRYQEKRVIEMTDIVAALELIGALNEPDNSRKDARFKDAVYRNSINTLSQLVSNPPENKVRGTLSFKLNWDFGAQIKVKEAQ